MKRKNSRVAWVSMMGFGVALFFMVADPSTASAQGNETVMKVQVAEARMTFNQPDRSPAATYFLVVGEISRIDGTVAAGRFISRGVITRPREFNQLFRLKLPDLEKDTPLTAQLTFADVWFRIFGREPLKEDTIIGSGGVFAGGRGAIVAGTGQFEGASGSYSQLNLEFPVPLGTGMLEFELRLQRK